MLLPSMYESPAILKYGSGAERASMRGSRFILGENIDALI
jgi:hypothetical protein